VTHGRGGEHLERHVVDDAAALVERATVAVRRVLAHAHVRDHVEVRGLRLEFADGLLDYAILRERPRAGLVLRLGQAEEDDRRDTEAEQVRRLALELVDRKLEHARHRGDLVACALARLHEQRVDEIARIERGLAHHRAQDLAGAQAAHPHGRERHLLLAS
jgi:hypothetical protein